jgi:hypothetical protein
MRKLTAVPAQRMSPRAYAWSRRFVIGAVAFAAFTGPLSLIMARSASTPQTVVTAATFPVPVTGFAENVAADWASGLCTSLPVADGVDSCFGRRRSLSTGTPVFSSGAPSLYSTATEQVLINDQPATAYISTFQVATPDNVYLLSVTVRLVRLSADSKLYPVLAAAPTVLPAKLAPTEVADGLPYSSNAFSSTPSKALKAKVELWADAYATDNRTALRLVVGGGPDATYPGLGGATATAVTTGEVMDRADGFSYVRAAVTFTGEKDSPWLGVSEFDLLVSSAQSPDPLIVAWGAVGSGPTLAPYSNNEATL